MMADSTVFAKSSDIAKLKVVELKKELKSRGLSTAGDKSELLARLQAAINKDSVTEDTLDSDGVLDELDSDGVLDDDDEDKNVGDDIINEVSASNVLNESTVSADKPDSASGNSGSQVQPSRVLKRRPPPIISSSESVNEDKLLSPDSEPSPPKMKITPPDDAATPAKKIVLNRVPVTAPASQDNDDKAESKSEEGSKPKIIKINMDPKERMEMRAKRFGLPATGESVKEARKARFGNSGVASSPSQKIGQVATAPLDVLKKRAERFGISVSKVMVDVENKEKLERRKAKFGLVKT